MDANPVLVHAFKTNQGGAGLLPTSKPASTDPSGMNRLCLSSMNDSLNLNEVNHIQSGGHEDRFTCPKNPKLRFMPAALQNAPQAQRQAAAAGSIEAQLRLRSHYLA